MFRCGYCDEITKRIPVTGTLVIGNSQVTLSHQGELVFSAIVPELTFNLEGYKRYVVATCPNCGVDGSLDDFIPVRLCFFTKQPVDAGTPVVLFERELYVHSSIRDDVLALEHVSLEFPRELLHV